MGAFVLQLVAYAQWCPFATRVVPNLNQKFMHCQLRKVHWTLLFGRCRPFGILSQATFHGDQEDTWWCDVVWYGTIRYCIVSMVFFGRNIYLRQNSRKQRFLFSVFCRNFSLLNKTLLPFPTQSRSQIWQVAWSEARQDQSEVWPKKIIWCNFWGRTEQRRLW